MRRKFNFRHFQNMEEDTLFNQDIVRDFMVSKGGKVRNHDLVTHFRSFLNDPNRKGEIKVFLGFTRSILD